MTQDSPCHWLRALLTLKCPRCGKGSVFQSFMTLRERCNHCHFPLKDHDNADGPAYTTMFFVGLMVTPLAFAVERAYQLSLLEHLAIWLPVILALSLWLLHHARALFIALHYKFHDHGQS